MILNVKGGGGVPHERYGCITNGWGRECNVRLFENKKPHFLESLNSSPIRRGGGVWVLRNFGLEQRTGSIAWV